MDAVKWIFGILDAIRKWFEEPPAQHAADLARALTETVPSFIDAVTSVAYQRFQGAFIGLATDNLVPAIVGVVVVMTIVTMFGNSSRWFQRLFRSLGGFLLLFALFATVLNLATQSSTAMNQFVFYVSRIQPGALATQLNNAFSNITLFLGLENLFATSIVKIASMAIQFELEVFKYIALLLLLVYPVAILFYPFWKWAKSLLHTANASLVTIVFAPSLMSLAALGPHVLSQLGFGTKGTFQAVATVVLIVYAALLPFILWGLARAGSVKITGKVEANITGQVDTKHTGELTAKIKNEPNALKSYMTVAVVKTSTKSAITGIEEGSFSEGVKRVAVGAGAAALAGAGHPLVGAALQGADAARRKHAVKKAENDASQQPPTVTPQFKPPPKPPSSPSSP